MKFLCDNCKAKYQIADDKVQGKTLRMKCRKCGHTIEIRALEGGASPSGGETMQVNALGEEHAAAVAAALGHAPAPASPLEPAKPAAPRPAAGAAAAPAPRPTTGAGAAPRPTTGTGPAAPRPTTGTGPAAPRPTTGTGPAAPRPTTGTGPAAPKADPGQSALASAFKKSVDDAPASQHLPQGDARPALGSTATSADPPAEEWYAAIGEVPVGPIRLAELRAKYTQGNVTDDTLVWREGFEEWRPLVTLTELHRLVKEEVSGASAPRGSLLPQGQSKSTSARPQQAAPRPQGGGGVGGGAGGFAGSPRAPVVQPSRSNVIPFDRAAARKLDDEMEDLPTQIAAAPILAPTAAAAAAAAGATAKHDDPFASAAAAPAKADPFADPFAPAPAPVAKAADPFAPVAAPPASGPQGVSPVPAAAAGVPTTRLDDHPHRETMLDQISQKTGVSKGVAGLAAAACLLLGVVIAVLVVGRKTVVQERIVEKQVAGPTVTVTVTVPGASAGPAPVASASETAAPKVAVKGGGGGSGASPTPTTSSTGGGVKGLDLGPAGPDVPGGPGTSGGGSGGGGEKLSGQQVETVVSSKRTSVRKSCYEPYSDKGSATAKIRLNINADGSVSSVDLVSTTGDSAIGTCVQKLARGWRFPASGSGGTFDVPFFFGT